MAHVVFALLFATVYNTWGITIAVTAGAALIFYIPERLYPGSVLTRNMAGLALQIFVMLYIYQMHGLAEMHFFFFTGTTAMIIYQDWKCIWLGAVVIIIQHIIFATLINTGTQGLYYFEQADNIPALKLFLHFSIVAGETALAGYFAHLLQQRTLQQSVYSDKLAQQSTLIETAYHKLEIEDKRKTEELGQARNLQQSILPSNALNMPGFRMMASMQACTEVGGDYYDYYIHPQGKITLALGDATGHGMQAAIIVAACKSLFQTFVRRTDLSNTFLSISEGIQNLRVKGAYMGLTLFEIEDGEVRCISSGMPPLLHYQGSTGAVAHLSEPGPFIGHSAYPTNAKVIVQKVHPGDKLFLCTDGLFERFDAHRNFLGFRHIQAVFQSNARNDLHKVMNSLLEYSEKWQQNGPIVDDTTVLLMHFT